MADVDNLFGKGIGVLLFHSRLILGLASAKVGIFGLKQCCRFQNKIEMDAFLTTFMNLPIGQGRKGRVLANLKHFSIACVF